MNFKDNTPIYIQIAERICDEICDGKYPPSERIPSVREYSAMVEVNTNTVMRSYDLLQSREIISTKRGVGYFVQPGAVETIIEERRTTFLKEELPQFYARIKSLEITIEEVASLLQNIARADTEK